MGKSSLDFDLKFPMCTEDKTIALVGIIGNGKSATGNSIIGADVFGSMPTCQTHWTVLDDGQILNVIDTPGIFDSIIDPNSTGKELAKCINMAKNGIHAILVVVSSRAHFSLEEASAIESLKQFFGGKFGDYMISVFTHGDAYTKRSFDDFLARSCPEPLKRTLSLCGNRYVLFDNVTEDEVKKSQQLRELLRLVDTVVDNNDGVSYTNELSFDSLDMSGNGLNKAYEDQMNGFLEKIESKFQETALMLEKQLAEERIARMEAEAKAQEAQMKYFHEMSRRLKLDLDRAQRYSGELQTIQTETEHKCKETELKFKDNQKKNSCAISKITLELEHQMNSKLQEMALRFAKQLADEKVARMQAEKKAQEAQRKSNDEIRKLREDMENQKKFSCAISEIKSGIEHQIESKLQEWILQLAKLLADKNVAIMKAEDTTQEVEQKSNEEISKLSEDLERAQRDGETNSDN